MRISTRLGNSGAWVSMGPVGWFIYFFVFKPVCFALAIVVWVVMGILWLLLELLIRLCELFIWIYNKVVHQWLASLFGT